VLGRRIKWLQRCLTPKVRCLASVTVSLRELNASEPSDDMSKKAKTTSKPQVGPDQWDKRSLSKRKDKSDPRYFVFRNRSRTQKKRCRCGVRRRGGKTRKQANTRNRRTNLVLRTDQDTYLMDERTVELAKCCAYGRENGADELVVVMKLPKGNGAKGFG
jgi:hypothetical protein